MFLIECSEDNSLSIIEDESVIFTDSVKTGDTVQFHYKTGKKTWNGTVVGRSDSRTLLETLLADMEKKRKDENKLKNKNSLQASNTIKTHKRESKKRERFSPSKGEDDKPPKKTKQGRKPGKQNTAAKHESLKKLFLESDSESSENDYLSDKVAKEKEKQLQKLSSVSLSTKVSVQASPSKEELKLMLAEALAGKAKLNFSSILEATKVDASKSPVPSLSGTSSHTTPEKKSDTEDDDELSSGDDDGKQQPENNDGKQQPKNDDRKQQHENDEQRETINDLLDVTGRQLHQLYGKDYCENGEKMVLLRDGIYCRQSQLSFALGSSKVATHFIRKIFLGVFIEDQLKNATLTGAPPKAAGKVPNPSKIVPLDPKAVTAITKYTRAVAKKMNWPIPEAKDFRLTLTQRVGEVKRDIAARQKLTD